MRPWKSHFAFSGAVHFYDPALAATAFEVWGVMWALGHDSTIFWFKKSQNMFDFDWKFSTFWYFFYIKQKTTKVTKTTSFVLSFLSFGKTRFECLERVSLGEAVLSWLEPGIAQASFLGSIFSFHFLYDILVYVIIIYSCCLVLIETFKDLLELFYFVVLYCIVLIVMIVMCI